MKKLLLAVPVIAGTAWAGTSYFVGVQSEAGYDQLLTQLGDLKPYVFTKESYESGLTTSRAVTLVKNSAAADAEVLLRLNHEIAHSPVRIEDSGAQIASATITTTLLDHQAVDDPVITVIDAFDGEDPFELITTVTPGGDLESRLITNDFSMVDGNSTFKLAASEFDFSFIDYMSKGGGQIGAFEMTNSDDDIVVKVEASDFRVDTQHRPGQYPLANWFWTIPKATLASTENDRGVEIDDIKLDLLSHQSDDKSEVGATANLHLGDLVVIDPEDPNIGKVMNSFDLKWVADGLDSDAMDEITNSLAKFKINGNVRINVLLKEMGTKYFDLITRNSQSNAKVSFINDGGEMSMDYSLRSIDDKTNAAFDNVVTIKDVLELTEIDANVKIDKAMLELLPTDAGIDLTGPRRPAGLVDSGDAMTTTVRLRNTVLTLNDQTIPILEMTGGMEAMPIEAIFSMIR